MIKVTYPEPTDEGWLAWHRRAEAASKLLQEYAAAMAQVEYEGYEAPEIRDALYKWPRKWLVEAFNGKCAFCESRIDATQPGDVEHFRPKGAVHRDDGTTAQFKTRSGKVIEHPGYFWLAYDWSNLLIACNTCNRSAKRNFFPVEDEDRRALSPGGLAQEVARFVNPLQEDPSLDIRFEDTGLAIPCSPRGEKCVEFLKLNRDALVEERKETYDNVLLKFLRYLGLSEADPEFAKLKTELSEWQAGRRKFAAQARVALAKAHAELAKKLSRLAP